MLKVLKYIWKRPLIVFLLIVAIFAGVLFIVHAVNDYKLEKTSDYTLIIDGNKYFLPRKIKECGVVHRNNQFVSLSQTETSTYKWVNGNYYGLIFMGYNADQKPKTVSNYDAIGFSVLSEPGIGIDVLSNKHFKGSATFLGVSIGDDASKIAGGMSKTKGFVPYEDEKFTYINESEDPSMYIKFFVDESDKVTGFELLPSEFRGYVVMD